jgi:hypothetical protein
MNSIHMNLKGAKDRPDLDQIWDNVDAKLHDKPIVYKDYHTQTLGGSKTEDLWLIGMYTSLILSLT